LNQITVIEQWYIALYTRNVGNYLLIRVGMFSEDIITTGTSFITDDSCLK